MSPETCASGVQHPSPFMLQEPPAALAVGPPNSLALLRYGNATIPDLGLVTPLPLHWSHFAKNVGVTSVCPSSLLF